MTGKGLVTSKTFWLNTFSFVAWFAGLLPAEYAVPIVTVANVGVRLVTDSPIVGFLRP